MRRDWRRSSGRDACRANDAGTRWLARIESERRALFADNGAADEPGTARAGDRTRDFARRSRHQLVLR